MYVRLYVRKYVCRHVCMHVRMSVLSDVCAKYIKICSMIDINDVCDMSDLHVTCVSSFTDSLTHSVTYSLTHYVKPMCVLLSNRYVVV